MFRQSAVSGTVQTPNNCCWKTSLPLRLFLFCSCDCVETNSRAAQPASRPFRLSFHCPRQGQGGMSNISSAVLWSTQSLSLMMASRAKRSHIPAAWDAQGGMCTFHFFSDVFLNKSSHSGRCSCGLFVLGINRFVAQIKKKMLHLVHDGYLSRFLPVFIPSKQCVFQIWWGGVITQCFALKKRTVYPSIRLRGSVQCDLAASHQSLQYWLLFSSCTRW